MAFENKVTQYPNRVRLTLVEGTEDVYEMDFSDVQGEVEQEGTQLEADEMNQAVQDLIDSSMEGIDVGTNGVIKLSNIRVGKVTFTPSGTNRATTVNVKWSEPLPTVPQVVVTGVTSVPNVAQFGVQNITVNGFQAVMYRTTKVNTSACWIAISY